MRVLNGEFPALLHVLVVSHSFSHAFPVKKKFLLANKHITKCVRLSPLLY